MKHNPSFSYLDRAYFFSLQFDFRTEFKTGLLFFISGARGEHFFVQLTNGEIHVEISAEEGKHVFQIVYSSDERNLCDGEWHTVQVVFNYNRALLKIDVVDGWYASNEVQQSRVYLRAAGTATFGGIKIGSDSERYVNENVQRLVKGETFLSL